ncbi:hypothetical protein D3OALGB2SA_1616 [Olavius algarvensis associated proteobacterium Delta 3]|nr:hypothetical protein D3OALGB2SA_1616 [Olavius algarvensis associated proteobacterium Delta 3]
MEHWTPDSGSCQPPNTQRLTKGQPANPALAELRTSGLTDQRANGQTG